jgi:hypothetical protein
MVCEKVTNIPSCILELIRDHLPDKKGMYCGRTFQLYGNNTHVREVLLIDIERALRCIRTDMTNITNICVYYELACNCILQNYNNGYLQKKYGGMYCETFISYLAKTCSQKAGLVTSQGNVDVDEEGYMAMMFKKEKHSGHMMHWTPRNGFVRGEFMTWPV